jgi:hypothetical protein
MRERRCKPPANDGELVDRQSFAVRFILFQVFHTFPAARFQPECLLFGLDLLGLLAVHEVGPGGGLRCHSRRTGNKLSDAACEKKQKNK